MKSPDLCTDVPDSPSDVTRVYFDDGKAFGSPRAPHPDDPAVAKARIAELEGRLLEMTALARSASSREIDLLDRCEHQVAVAQAACRDAHAALAREGVAHERVRQLETRVVIAETRVDLARAISLKFLRRPRAASIEQAFDRAARAITTRDHAELVADLDRQVAEYPDDDEKHVIDVPIDPDEQAAKLDLIARTIRGSRTASPPRLTERMLVELADLAIDMIDAERAIDEHERSGSGPMPYRLLEDRDDIQRALKRAVRR